MDAIGLVASFASVASKAAAALANLNDIKQDGLALSILVQRLAAVVEAAGRLSKHSSIPALEGLNGSMAECLAVAERLAKSSTIAKFFTAGNHVAELRAVALRLSNDLSAFQTSMGIEQHADIETLLADLANVPLEVLCGFEALAGQLFEQMDCPRANARVAARAASSSAGAAMDEERIAAAVLASLEQAGVVKKSATGMSAQDVADVTAALQGGLTELRRDKQDIEAQYLSHIVAALTLSQAEVGYGGSSSSSRGAAAPAASSMLPDFLCPITMCVMRDPVIVESGHSFEREAIQQHLAMKDTNPVTNLRLTSKTLIDNITLRNSIQSWLNQLGLTHEQADTELPAAAAPPVPKYAPTEAADQQLALPDWTLLLLAARDGHVEVVRDLLEAGANKDAADEDGRTPLRFAARDGYVEVVRILLEAGANKDAADEDGRAPLMWAACGGHVEVVRVLLEAGANKDAADEEGWKAFSFAGNNVELVGLLQE